jgi:hypothetical protein
MATLRSHAYNDCRPLGLYVSFSTFPERTECPRNTPVAGLKGEDMDKHYGRAVLVPPRQWLR